MYETTEFAEVKNNAGRQLIVGFMGWWWSVWLGGKKS